MAVVLAVVTAISPITADAATKKVVTREEYQAYDIGLYDDPTLSIYDLHTAMYNYVKSLNGCYNEKGVKIHAVLDGKTKKLTKTGKYDIIVGGKTAKTDQGTVKFVAPKAGTYRFTFSVKNNVTGNNVCILPFGGFSKMKTDYYYVANGKKYSDNTSGYILLAVEGNCTYYNSGTALDYQSGRTYSEMRTITGTQKLKKGESIILECRNPKADLDEDYAYRFTDFCLTITKTK